MHVEEPSYILIGKVSSLYTCEEHRFSGPTLTKPPNINKKNTIFFNYFKNTSESEHSHRLTVEGWSNSHTQRSPTHKGNSRVIICKETRNPEHRLSQFRRETWMDLDGHFTTYLSGRHRTSRRRGSQRRRSQTSGWRSASCPSDGGSNRERRKRQGVVLGAIRI